MKFIDYYLSLHPLSFCFPTVKSPGASQKVIQQLEEQLLQKERLMTETTRTWIDRLKSTEQRKLEEIDYMRRIGISLGVENTLPNLVNLNEDPQVRFTHTLVPETFL